MGRIESERCMRDWGIGPWGRGWKAGQGREGSVCFGAARGGRGPCTRRRAEGGARRGPRGMVTSEMNFYSRSSERLLYTDNNETNHKHKERTKE